MDATFTFFLTVFLTVGIAALMWVALMIYGSARGKRLPSPSCPECGCELRVIREPKSIKQVIWGGWTCSGCGCHIDKWGIRISD